MFHTVNTTYLFHTPKVTFAFIEMEVKVNLNVVFVLEVVLNIQWCEED